MKSATQTLVDKLFSQIYTAPSLREVSLTLEDLTQNKHFKNHANHIVNDATLSPTQKQTQLGYLIRSVENTLVYNFLSDELGADNLWLFDNEKIDYFDEFVQEFQQATENVKILQLTTAAKLSETQLKNIARDLTQEFTTKVILSYQINPSLIGGVQVKIDNYVFDFSLRTKFQQFQREWLASLDKNTKLVGRYDANVMEE